MNNPSRVAWLSVHRFYVFASTVISAALIVVLAVRIPMKSLPLAIGIGIVGVMHALPSIGERRRIKSFPIIKNVFIASAWVVGGIVIPLAADLAVSVMQIIVLCLYRLPIILSNQLVADYIDRDGDSLVGNRSVSSEWQESTVKHVAIALLMASIAFGVALALTEGEAFLMAIDLVGQIIMLLVCIRTRVFSVDTVFMLDLLVGWPLFTFLMSCIF